MISPPPGWAVAVRQGSIELTLPQGAGRISYRERVRPLISVRALLETKVGREQDFHTTQVGPIEQLVTHEGEYAALVALDGTMNDLPAQRTLGFVFLDDCYARLHGLARREEHFATVAAAVRRLVVEDRHHMRLRRRRALYTPPPGWTGRPYGPFIGQWLAPDYPRSETSLYVLPALPRLLAGDEGVELVEQELPAPWETHAIQGPVAVSVSGFAGTGRMWRLAGKGAGGLLRSREVLILSDEHFVYPLVVETPPAEDRVGRMVLDQVSATLKPIPGVFRAQSGAAALWTE